MCVYHATNIQITNRGLLWAVQKKNLKEHIPVYKYSQQQPLLTIGQVQFEHPVLYVCLLLVYISIRVYWINKTI